MKAKHPIDDVFDRVEDLYDHWIEQQEEQEKGAPWQARSATDAEHVMWFEEQMRMYPPEPWVSPEGQMVMQSPWLLALPYTEGGKDEVRRYIRTKMGQAMEAYDGTAS